ncbi:Tetrahydrodipicolinate N-acetyltransferase [Scedosporium apiospermum]|uniref:Tetrahydrodipicolinate N-acetyltransferase n=1 Tax=Pseudallescheria apiosperma TaxID=563466 RepID=A0A084G5H7_PSEDA|nr:Tetrahydrodipicolinate N-acetyltransferase [Scedosporium apiospermum]KEZ42589.1 Tetrahydrodipicolinate N-acetyltransferase [Scedosporium apiospermum]
MQDSSEFAAENRRRMHAGELYYAFTPDLTADRRRCGAACARYNAAGGNVSRRHLLELWKELGKNVYVNFGSTWLDTCLITVGDRTLIGPNCSFFSATHPLDPTLRNGTSGPESGKPIVIGPDCWLGGNVTILAGVTIGRGSTVGAASVVTKDVPEYTCVAGNPARIIKRVDVSAPPPDEGGAVVTE